jgi:hypothetical protein
MGKQRDLHYKHKKARTQLAEVFQNSEHVCVVHYSCESFYNRGDNPQSPRITSIAVRNLESAQTHSFSIHLVAERQGMLESIQQHFDALERQMLEGFFDFARTRQHCSWLHWNMRDANYGFIALENRLRALGGVPFEIDERKRIDLARLLIAIYGVGYIQHPRLDSLMKLNHITTVDFMTGQEEADAFVNGQYVALHQSTLRKVDVLANIAERAHSDNLDTLASWWERNGGSIKATSEWIKEHWLVSLCTTVVSIALWIYQTGNNFGLM